MGRKPVDEVIDELNYLDNHWGVGSVVIHDSMFFQNPSWLEEWIEKYPRKANKRWPYWAAGALPTRCGSGRTCSRRWFGRRTGT